MIDLYRAPNPRYSMSNLIPCLFEKIYQPREMLLWPARPKLWPARPKLWPARPKLWPARPKLWPARPKLWPAQRGKHSIKLTYDPRLSDKSGGPAPPCDGYIRLLAAHFVSHRCTLRQSGAVSGRGQWASRTSTYVHGYVTD